MLQELLFRHVVAAFDALGETDAQRKVAAGVLVIERVVEQDTTFADRRVLGNERNLTQVGSAFIGAFGVRLYGYITSSIFSIPAYIGPYFVYAAIGWVIAFGLSFALSYLFVVKMDRS